MAMSFMIRASLFSSWSALRLQALLKPCQKPSCRQGCKQPSQQEACEQSAGRRPLDSGPSCTKLHCFKLPALSSMDSQAADAAPILSKGGYQQLPAYIILESLHKAACKLAGAVHKGVWTCGQMLHVLNLLFTKYLPSLRLQVLLRPSRLNGF